MIELGTIIYEFARNSTLLYSGMIMIIFALVISWMIAWRNINNIGIMLLPTSVIPIIIGFKPNVVVLLVFSIIFIATSWSNNNYNIQSAGLGESPAFQNR
jgi:hypothetical protein